VAITPSASYSVTIRAAIKNRPGMLGRLTSAIGEAGGDIRAVDLVELVKDIIVRDFTIDARDEQHAQAIVGAIRRLEGIQIVSVSDRTLLVHLGGKIEIRNKVPLKTRDELSRAYTPGVARVCLARLARRRRRTAHSY
jgi:malate dehydrogenase (oxaloacetate-decarboxylating)